jgi:Fe-S cluster biogenesis protein NfuA
MQRTAARDLVPREGEILHGSLFSEPMRVETVRSTRLTEAADPAAGWDRSRPARTIARRAGARAQRLESGPAPPRTIGDFSRQRGIIPSRHTRQWREPASFSGCRRRFPGIPLAPPVGMMTRERVEAVLGRVRPFLQADGGDIELIDISGNSADVKLTGLCARCPSAHMTLYLGIETALREEIPEFESLRLI